MLPDNATFDADELLRNLVIQSKGEQGTTTLTPQSKQIITVDGHRLLKLDFTNYDELYDGFDVIIKNLSNPVDAQTSSSDLAMLVLSDLYKGYNGIIRFAGSDHVEQRYSGPYKSTFLKIIQDANVDKEATYAYADGTWNIVRSGATTSATMTSTIDQPQPGLSTTQSDHTGNAMTLYGSVVNADPTNSLHNIKSIINLDQGTLNDHFKSVLSGAASVINSATGQALTGVDIKYSENTADLSQGASVDLSSYKSIADLGNDWSKVKSILVTVSGLPNQTSLRVVMPIVDHQIYDDVNKQTAVTSLTWSNKDDGTVELRPITINFGDDRSAVAKITGQSTIHTKVVYTDLSGHTHTVNLLDKDVTYQEGQDTMKKSDFLTSDSSLTATDKAQLPNVVIDYDNPTIENSNSDYNVHGMTSYSNGTAAFGQPVKYYFDGDTVVYKGKVIDPAVANTKAMLKFYDDTTNQYIAACPDLTDSNHTSDDISFVITDGYKNSLKGYVFKGTKEGTDPHSGTSITGDALDNVQYGQWTRQDRTFIAHFVHDIQPVDPGHPGHPNEPIDPDNPTSPKYPDGTEPAKLTKQITRTIHYVTKDAQGNKAEITGHPTVTQPVTYTAQGYLDKVTGQWVKSATDLTPVADQSKGLTWTTADSFAAQDSPFVTNYHITGVENEDGSPNVNDADGNNIKKITPEQSASDYDVYVVYAHDQVPAKVIYQDVNDPAHPTTILGKDIPDGDVDSRIPYSTKDELKTLTDEGYVLDSNEFDPNGTAPNFNSDASKNTYYVKLKHGTVTIYPNDSNTPKPNDPINPDDHRDDKPKYPNDVAIDNLKHSATRTIKITRPGESQTNLVKPQVATITRTVTIDKVNGHVVGQPSAWNKTNGTWTAVTIPTIDGYTAHAKVKGGSDISSIDQFTIKPDTGDQEIDITYTANKQNAKLVFIDDDAAHATQPLNKSESATGDSATAISFANGAADLTDLLNNQGYEFVSAIDKTDANNPRILASGSNTKYSQIPFGNYDTKDEQDQLFEIHLKHKLVPVTDQDRVTTDKQVHRDFTFKYDVPNTVTPPAVPTLTQQDLYFKGTGLIDKVTNKLATTDENGKITHEYDLTDDRGLTWKLVGGTSDNGKFVAPTMPTIPAGYHVESIKSTTVATPTDSDWATETGTSIAAKDGIKHNSHDIQVLVTLVPDPQTANLNFVDDTTGSTLSDWDSTTGVSDQSSIIFANGDHILQHYLDNGYKFVNVTNDIAQVSLDGDDYASAAQNFGNFDHDTKNDQNFTVHLVHTYITVTPEKPGTPGQPINHDPNGVKYPTGTDAQSLQHDVNRTIHYVYPDGTTAQPDHSDSKHYEETKVIDRVTGKVTKDTWDGPFDFDTITSPTIQGYTPDKTSVANPGIAHDHADITETVTYTPDAQKLTVTYIDDTTGQVLKTVTKDGYSDQSANYNTKNDIQGYEDQHYELVSDSTNGQNLVFDHDDSVDQSYTVHLKHQTVPTSQTKTITRTINYVDGQTGQRLKPSVTQTLTFTQTGTKDLVTGEITWDPTDPQSFASVDSPSIGGYNAPSIPVVGTQNVNMNDDNIVVNVTYDKPAPVIPSDQGQPNGGNGNGISTDHNDEISYSHDNGSNGNGINNSTTITSGTTNTEATNKQTTLPQTGNNAKLGALGLLTASFAGLLGFRKKKED